jgi:hypothetical protein
MVRVTAVVGRVFGRCWLFWDSFSSGIYYLRFTAVLGRMVFLLRLSFIIRALFENAICCDFFSQIKLTGSDLFLLWWGVCFISGDLVILSPTIYMLKALSLILLFSITIYGGLTISLKYSSWINAASLTLSTELFLLRVLYPRSNGTSASIVRVLFSFFFWNSPVE